VVEEKQHLSYEEFVSLLQRSTVLQAGRGTDRYSKDDLLRAARELDIEEAVAADLVDTYLSRRSALEVSPRPFDTRIQLSTAPGTFDLTVPPLPLSPRTLTPFGFVLFWFGFIAFWTHGALRAGGIFAAFSIPFWTAGIGMLWRFAMPLLQTTRLRLDRDGGSLQNSPLGRSRKLGTPELRARIGEYTRYRHEGFRVDRKAGKAVLLEHGTETLPLLDGFSEQEQRWIESELQVWLLASNPALNLPGLRPAG
jgi:hypothetical protein